MSFPPTIANFIFLAALLSTAAVTKTQALQFSFANFTSNDYFQLVYGDSTTSAIQSSAIQVTADLSSRPIDNLAGRVLYNKMLSLRNRRGKNASFNTTFVLNILNKTNPGGEGMAFIVTGHTKVPSDSYGHWLGIVNAQLNGSREAETVAIEFDTRKSSPDDMEGNHIALNVNSISSRRQFLLQSINLSNGVDVLVNVRYDGKNLSVSVGNNVTMPFEVFSEEIDLSAYLPKKVYVGFSGSTSNFTELNCVRSWSFQSDDETVIRLWLVVAVPVGVVFLLGVFFFWLWRRRYATKTAEDLDNIEDEINGWSTAPTKFNLKDLSKATDKFSESNVLGKGGFGKVYKGIWNGQEIAVKKITKEKAQGKQEFISEVTTIGNLNHRNLVKLIGWCSEKAGYLLVYEYMEKGSLDKILFPENDPYDVQKLLSWRKRINILSDVALGVDYLHGGCGKTVFHRDIKPSNIMLDAEFNAKLGDFGLARTIKKKGETHYTTAVMAGTPGYIAPEFTFTGRSTAQTDVYSFGVVALEVACGKRPGFQNEGCYIVNWVWDLHAKGAILEAADERLNSEYDEEEMQCLLVLGLACCHPNPFDRPSMSAVSQVLRGEAPVPEVPKERPRFMWPVMSSNESDISLIGSQLEPFTIIGGR